MSNGTNRTELRTAWEAVLGYKILFGFVTLGVDDNIIQEEAIKACFIEQLDLVEYLKPFVHIIRNCAKWQKETGGSL